MIGVPPLFAGAVNDSNTDPLPPVAETFVGASGTVGFGDAGAVMRPIELLPVLVNHIAPSGPAAMPYGSLMVASKYEVNTPFVVIRPIEPSAGSVTHRGAVGPGVMPYPMHGVEMGDGSGGGDPTDRIVAGVGEPQRAVRSGRDADRVRDERVGEVGDRVRRW